ncbi:hypothetical protein AGLY_004415, partial [Aphis glycines]
MAAYELSPSKTFYDKLSPGLFWGIKYSMNNFKFVYNLINVDNNKITFLIMLLCLIATAAFDVGFLLLFLLYNFLYRDSIIPSMLLVGTIFKLPNFNILLIILKILVISDSLSPNISNPYCKKNLNNILNHYRCGGKWPDLGDIYIRHKVFESYLQFKFEINVSSVNGSSNTLSQIPSSSLRSIRKTI